MIKKIGIILTIVLFFSSSILAAKERSLSGIDIIPRTARINDASIIYKQSPQTTETKTTDTDQEDNKPTTPSKINIINTYLRQVFPEQFLLDEIIDTVEGKKLSRSRGYQYHKTHIVVHHTVNNLKDIKTPEDALKTINAIFKFHTESRDRGDIGYNFIIDPRGNIYEGRGGGDSVIGAHAKYNNAPSIGIALLGNFEIDQPTEQQIAALTKLSVALMIRYHINPDNQIYAHIEDDHYPYVKDEVRNIFMGHRDTGKTSCPGANLYNKLEDIRQSIKEEFNKMPTYFPLKKVRYVYNYPTVLYATTDTSKLSIVYPLPHKIRGCKILNKGIRVSKCLNNSSAISFTLRKASNTVGPERILLDFADRSGKLYRVVLQVKRASDDAIILKQRREYYLTTHSKPNIVGSNTKLSGTIALNDIPQLISNPVSVLLYELSTTTKERKINCNNCTVTDDQGNSYLDKSFTINNNGSSLSYTSRAISKTTLSSLIISTNKADSRIFFTNYPRKSYGGVSRNNFYGSIIISKQQIKPIDSQKIVEQYTIVNRIPFDRYLRGIIESNDSEPTEKINTMAILAKNYITYYLSPLHRHPSIPAGTNYTAVDDARIFQKYVGAGVDDTLSKRRPALEATKNKFIMYNNNLAFLPYFSCSAGFTRSAAEKWGWTDTPYLISVIDPDYCDEFAGHGVGLAGKGASKLANQGMQYPDIIKYYYPGTSLEQL